MVYCLRSNFKGRHAYAHEFFEEQLFAHSNVDLLPVLRKKRKFDDFKDDK